MGVDIYMSLIDKDGNLIMDNLYDTRNYDWFDNMSGSMCDFEYSYLPTECGLPGKVPEKIKEIYEKRKEWGYTDFRYINVSDYFNWFKEYRPELKAGWVSTYDKWRIERKHWIPESDQVLFSLDEVVNKNDYHFIEYEDEECPDRKIINKIIDWIVSPLYKGTLKDYEEALKDFYIIYYFSH